MIYKREFFVGANDIDYSLNIKDKAILKLRNSPKLTQLINYLY